MREWFEKTRVFFSLYWETVIRVPLEVVSRARETAFIGDAGKGRAYFKAVAEEVVVDRCLGGGKVRRKALPGIA